MLFEVEEKLKEFLPKVWKLKYVGEQMSPLSYEEIKERIKAIEKTNLNGSNQKIDKIVEFRTAVEKLFQLSIITSPHWKYTRYPDGKIKPSDYNENLGIVRAFLEIEKEMKFILDSFSKYIEQ